MRGRGDAYVEPPAPSLSPASPTTHRDQHPTNEHGQIIHFASPPLTSVASGTVPHALLGLAPLDCLLLTFGLARSTLLRSWPGTGVLVRWDDVAGTARRRTCVPAV